MEKLSHYDAEGSAHMVDVSAKPATRREAEASAFVVLSDAVLAACRKTPRATRSRSRALPAFKRPNARLT
jgi:cyclic pyranopterin phosphate synthase